MSNHCDTVNLFKMDTDHEIIVIHFALFFACKGFVLTNQG